MLRDSERCKIGDFRGGLVMNRPVHFEIPAEKPERAIQFYEKVFGWKFERWNGPMEYWNISTGDSHSERPRAAMC
jgi:predicted enzyme related to lactoylglutathione lyase